MLSFSKLPLSSTFFSTPAAFPNVPFFRFSRKTNCCVRSRRCGGAGVNWSSEAYLSIQRLIFTDRIGGFLSHSEVYLNEPNTLKSDRIRCVPLNRKKSSIIIMSSKRKEMDIRKLMMQGFKVETIDDSSTEFIVILNGPPNSPYAGGAWKVKIELSEHYPDLPPSIDFTNRIYHPNIDQMFGTVCLDLLTKDWSPMFDLVHVFEYFLPQLLLQPNPSDPMNEGAAALHLSDKKAYEEKVREQCQLYAKPTDEEATTSGPADP